MAAVDVLAIIVIFTAGMIAGVIILVSAASRREDRAGHVLPAAPDRLSLAGRYLSGLYVRRRNSERALGDDDIDEHGPDIPGRRPR
jgi:hypothetical protein